MREQSTAFFDLYEKADTISAPSDTDLVDEAVAPVPFALPASFDLDRDLEHILLRLAEFRDVYALADIATEELDSCEVAPFCEEFILPSPLEIDDLVGDAIADHIQSSGLCNVLDPLAEFLSSRVPYLDNLD